MTGRVTGIGGLFFRAKDPAALGEWYEIHLGINSVPTTAEMSPWMTDAGATVFSPFPDDTEYFPEDRHHMVNFRVDDLDAILKRLADAGIDSSHHQQMQGVGRFARIHDPEGNPIELWEPAA